MEALGGIAGDGKSAMLAPTGEVDEDSWTQNVINEEVSRFESIIDDEMNRISGSWGGSETAPKDWAGFQSKDDYRYTIRPMYYSQGYTDPADFLSEQVEFALLGKPQCKTWVHKDLAEILGKLPGVLNGWSARLADTVAKDLGGTIGLQMRRIANSEELSNHAFGCAIDVNALGNPHVVGPAVVEVFNWVVHRAGVFFDFGKAILTKEEQAPYTKYTVDDIMEISNRAIPASGAVKGWLKIHLPRYRKLMERVQNAEMTLGIMKVDSKKSLASRYQNAQNARNGLKKTALKKRSDQRDGGAQGARSDRPEADALGEIDTVFQEITTDQDLSRIQILYEHYDLGYINTWEKQGVMGIPMYLAAALVGKLDLDWGEEYESSKDAMHFELIGDRKHWAPHIEPDDKRAKGEKPRTLKRLIECAFQSKIPKLRLDATLKL